MSSTNELMQDAIQQMYEPFEMVINNTWQKWKLEKETQKILLLKMTSKYTDFFDVKDSLERVILYRFMDESISREKVCQEIKKIFHTKYSEKLDSKIKDVVGFVEYAPPKQVKKKLSNAYSLKDIANEAVSHISDIKIVKRNNWHFKDFESDILVFTKDKNVHELEIKRTYQDFLNDFKKKSQSQNIFKHQAIQNGDLSDYFWFVVPSHLYANKIKPAIPKYAGVIGYFVNHENKVIGSELIRQAPKLTQR